MARRSTALSGGELYHLIRQRAQICASQLDRRPHSFDLLASIVNEAVEDGQILLEMESLIDHRTQAVELIRLAEQTLNVLVDSDQPPVLKMIARVAQQHLGRPQTALNALNRALEHTLTTSNLRASCSIYRKSKRSICRSLVTYQTYGAVLIPEEDDQDVPALRWYLEVAHLQESNLLDFEGAAATYEALLVEFPGDTRALNSLRQLLGRLRQLQRLAEVVPELASMTEAPKDVMLLVEGARSITSMGELPVAIPLWSQVLERAPGHDEAQDTVMRHGRRMNDLPMMRSVYRSKIRSAKGHHDVATAWCALAMFERDTARDDDAAIGAYQQALDSHPHHDRALMGLAELLLLHNRQETIPTLAKIMIERFDSGVDDLLKEDFAQLLGQLQVECANIVLNDPGERTESEQENAILDILSAGFVRAPNVRDLAQMYADRLYASGRLVDAGRIYDKTMFPSFIRGPLGDELRAIEHLRRAHALQSINLDVQAIHHFESAARHVQTRVEALAALAQIQETQNAGKQQLDFEKAGRRRG